MKKLFSNVTLIATVAIAGLFTSCSKDDNNNNSNVALATKEYKLYNYSNPTGPLEAGTVVFSQLADSTVSAKITLNSGFHQAGSTYSANIISSATIGDFLYANLTGVDGGTGTSTTVPVRNAASGTTIRYNQLISLTGYRIQVLNGGLVQATGTIQ